MYHVCIMDVQKFWTKKVSQYCVLSDFFIYNPVVLFVVLHFEGGHYHSVHSVSVIVVGLPHGTAMSVIALAEEISF